MVPTQTDRREGGTEGRESEGGERAREEREREGGGERERAKDRRKTEEENGIKEEEGEREEWEEESVCVRVDDECLAFSRGNYFLTEGLIMSVSQMTLLLTRASYIHRP